MEVSEQVEQLINSAAVYASKLKHEYVTPEHILYILTNERSFRISFKRCGGNIELLKKQLEEYLKENIERVEGEQLQIQASYGLNRMLFDAGEQTQACGKHVIEITHMIHSLMNLKDSYGAYFIHLQGISSAALLSELDITLKQEMNKEIDFEEEQEQENSLQKYAVCLNEQVDKENPLIGRELELERTIQILLRKYKNNPLHLGEPGVGKTAITYGLAKRINEKKVPDKLKNAKIYAVDIGSMVAGAQYRGEFERRFKELMEQVEKEENPILYLDEIHNIVGAGAVNGGSLDASNLLKPYLTNGNIRFIGATTYEEYKKYFSKSKSLVRRFQTIEIKEPSIEESIQILNGVKKYYEAFHEVKYTKGTIEHAVFLSDKYINERFLPDKAIDLIDEAGAYRVLHKKPQKHQTVDKALIEEVVSKIVNVPLERVGTEEIKQLEQLEVNLKKQVFGQDEAVIELTNAIKFSKAGLMEENKPICSVLFVGPTGVGKTELAKTTATVLGIPFLRFDMSEYAEKHTVAKLIGSPAGYVGYEEGGLLTEAIRKHPHCVLLLDEIEKAHADIFNVLLQVMDYATLTDNQGRKADFRNIVLIMTSNAGAAKASKYAMGFGEERFHSGAIMDEIKHTFQPEFRNRLDRIITFQPLTEQMAERIVEKQFRILTSKLEQKQIFLSMSDACKEYIRTKGLSREYGAREINRVIHSEIKPLLVDQILFGSLKKGGKAELDYKDGKCQLIL